MAAGCVLVGGTILVVRVTDARQPCAAYRDLDKICYMAEAWKAIRGRYPDSIRAMVQDGNSDGLGFELYPKDPYGREYGYWIIDDQPLVIFYGADGAPGGEGEDRDWLWPRNKPLAKALPFRCIAR